MQYPCLVLSALSFLERLASYYGPSRGVLQLLKITRSLVLPQEQSTNYCLLWGHHHEKPAHLPWQNPLPSVCEEETPSRALPLRQGEGEIPNIVSLWLPPFPQCCSDVPFCTSCALLAQPFSLALPSLLCSASATAFPDSIPP